MLKEEFIEAGKKLINLENLNYLLKLFYEYENEEYQEFEIICFENNLTYAPTTVNIFVDYYISANPTYRRSINLYILIAILYNFLNCEEYTDFIQLITEHCMKIHDSDSFNDVIMHMLEINKSVISNPEIQLWLQMQ